MQRDAQHDRRASSIYPSARFLSPYATPNQAADQRGGFFQSAEPYNFARWQPAIYHGEPVPQHQGHPQPQDIDHDQLEKDVDAAFAKHRFPSSSMTISPEFLEKAYCGGQLPPMVTLRTPFGDPTPIAIVGFIISMGPLSCDLMGWRGAPVSGMAGLAMYFFFGGMLMLIGGILSWVVGNTFPSVVFTSFGAYWLSYAGTFHPAFNAYATYAPHGAPAAVGLETPGFQTSWGFFHLSMGMLCFCFFVCSLRTNVVYVTMFAAVTAAFGIFTAVAWLSAENSVANADYTRYLLRIAGLSTLVATACGCIWQACQVRNGSLYLLAQTLHREYGPAVRVGPNEVWFNSKEAFKIIYASDTFEKSDFYLATALLKPRPDLLLRLEFPDTLDFLAERDMMRYKMQRRLVRPIYQASNLRRFQGAVDAVLEKAIAEIGTLQGREVDLKEWMHMIVVECLGAVVLSASPGYLRDHTDWGSSSHTYLGWKRKTVLGLFPLATVLSSLSKDFGRLFSDAWGTTYATPPRFKPFFPFVHKKVTGRVNHSFNKACRTEPAHNEHKDLLADLIQLSKEKPEFTETYLRRLAVTNFGAGHETTTSAMTCTLAMIGSHPEVQRRVADEARAAGMTASDDTVGLPYIQASIKEAQRLYPVIGTALPRRVPRGGLRVHGHHIPAGATVGCNPSALHRNSEIFGPDAHVYRPERWLSGRDTKAMERFNLTWGGGARTCPGRHLAELIVHRAVPALFKAFEMEVTMPPETEITYYFVAMLTGVKAISSFT
ncbi:hypothetical protein P8C59_004588 [Phyllachora maydis]|uniref:Cytochrome P450 n=1 Tax=Phyllachora maydis TaxID=1825666 RepID=A0AAD9I3V8_9PEZI|nr:hypothetical protein P8C59_004588 [Phyllachora maydis]